MPTGNLPALKEYLGLENSRNDLKNLKTHHKLIIMLHLEGLSNSDIASEVGRSPGYVRWVLSRPIVQDVVDQYFELTDREFKTLYKLSVRAVRDALSDKQDIRVRLNAADKFFRAHGKYESRDQRKTTSAEEVVSDIMSNIAEIVRSAGGTPGSGGQQIVIPQKQLEE